MRSRLQYANTKLYSPIYMNYSYVINSTYCEGLLRNFGPIKNYFLFSPPYAKTNCPLLVPIEHLQWIEGGATKCKNAHTFNLLYKDLMLHKLPSLEETQILNHLLVLQPHCNVDLYPRALDACLAGHREFLKLFRDPADYRAPDFEIKFLDIDHRPVTLGSPNHTVPRRPVLKTYFYTFLDFFLIF